MSAVNILIAVLGSGITLMVIVGIAFLTPRGVEAHTETPHRRPAPAQVVNPAKQTGVTEASGTVAHDRAPGTNLGASAHDTP